MCLCARKLHRRANIRAAFPSIEGSPREDWENAKTKLTAGLFWGILRGFFIFTGSYGVEFAANISRTRATVLDSFGQLRVWQVAGDQFILIFKDVWLIFEDV